MNGQISLDELTEKKIEVRSLFRGWVEVDREQAKRFAKGLMGNEESKNGRLRGITYAELMEEER